MAVNKIVYGDNTLLDLTSDTVDANHLFKGYTAHDKSGAVITGTMEEGSGAIGTGSVTATPSSSVLSLTFSGLVDNPVAWSVMARTEYDLESDGLRYIHALNSDGDGWIIEERSSAFGYYYEKPTTGTITGTYSDGSLVVTVSDADTCGYFMGGIEYELTYIYGTEASEVVVQDSKTVTENGTYTADDGYDAIRQIIVDVESGGGLPEGFSAIATGSHTLASDVASGTKFSIVHGLGVKPDMFIFYHVGNISSTYTMLYNFYSSNSEFTYRGTSYCNIIGYHSTSTSSVSNVIYNSTYGVYSISTDSATLTPYSNCYWRAGTYKWIAIKFS